jgi:hypothetical protein
MSLAVVASLTLIGCGGGGGGGGDSSTPTDTTLPFQLFPDNYFTEGYTESYQLTGSDTGGGKYTGSLLLQTQVEDTFDGAPAIPMQFLLEFTETQTNAFLSTSGFSYYSTDPSDRRLIGESFDDGTISMPTSTSAFPATATIGDFGTIGSYSSSDGTTSSAAWRLENANNGQAYLVIAWNYYDEFSNLDSTEEQQYLIQPDGTRLSIKLSLFIVSDTITVTFTGQRD